jgi:hypothetical protein
MLKKENRESNNQYRNSSNRALSFGLVSYLLLLLLASSLVLQGCDGDTISQPREELQISQQEDLEKRINELSQEDSDESENKDSDNQPINSKFTVLDTSLLDASVNIEVEFEDLTSTVYTLESNLGMELTFINVLGKKCIRIEVGENSYNCFIDINEMQAKVISGEYENYSIKINADYLYLYNEEGAYIFKS